MSRYSGPLMADARPQFYWVHWTKDDCRRLMNADIDVHDIRSASVDLTPTISAQDLELGWVPPDDTEIFTFAIPDWAWKAAELYATYIGHDFNNQYAGMDIVEFVIRSRPST